MGADINEKTDLKALAQERTWLRLLYFDEDAQQSEVVSDDYFLSENGKHNPLAELNATINAYSKPFGENPDAHPICRFPARYKWLSRNIELPNYQTVHPKCTMLRESLRKTEIDSVSLMFVSGYLGNPASSFGHSFLKLNNHDTPSNTDLFDLSISYGAEVPENENIFVYMYSGLFGKYIAKFSDKYFYTQDLVYTNNELRDIWEYKLDLPQEKVALFQLHLWEILGKKFQYRFLNKNCGYEVSKMLEVVVDENLVKRADFWFAPIESFHALAETDRSEALIGGIAYHPSEQKKIYKRFQTLTEAGKNAARSLILNDMQDKEGTLGSLSEEEQTDVIDFAISYYSYLLVKERGNNAYKKLKNNALIKRFALPAKRKKALHFDHTTPPDRNDKPSILFSNFNHSKEQQNYLSIGYAPYAIQSIGQNNLRGDELVVLESALGITPEKVFLEKFDLIRIKRFDRYRIPLRNENKFSWQLDISVQNIDIEHDRYDAFVKGGIGKTWIPFDWITGYAMINAALHTYERYVVLSPEIGARIDLDRAKTLISVQNEFDALEKQSHYKTEITSNIKLVKDVSLFVDYRYADAFRISAGLQYFF